MVAPPFKQTRVSNHKPMPTECPLLAAALQTGERHMYVSMFGAPYTPGMRSSLGGSTNGPHRHTTRPHVLSSQLIMQAPRPPSS
jgi:hypothetical protein